MLKYVDDSSIADVILRGQSSLLQLAVDHAPQWANGNKITINASKAKELCISLKRSQQPPAPVTIGGDQIEQVTTAKLLGVTLAAELSWGAPVEEMNAKAAIFYTI